MVKPYWKEVAKILFQTKAIQLNCRTPFVLVSKKISPIYVDNRRLISYPDERATIVGFLAKTIKKLELKEYTISGGETADIPFAAWVAWNLRRPLVYIRKEEKVHGLAKRVEGAVERIRNKSVVHVADLVTTGGSAISWIDALSQSRARIEHYLAIIDRSQGAREALKRRGVELHVLAEMNHDFFDYGRKLHLFSATDSQSAMDYLSDQEAWAKTFLRRHPEFIKQNGNLGLEVLHMGYPELRDESS